jgi:hypothetical protein
MSASGCRLSPVDAMAGFQVVRFRVMNDYGMAVSGAKRPFARRRSKKRQSCRSDLPVTSDLPSPGASHPIGEALMNFRSIQSFQRHTHRPSADHRPQDATAYFSPMEIRFNYSRCQAGLLHHVHRRRELRGTWWVADDGVELFDRAAAWGRKRSHRRRRSQTRENTKWQI